MTKDDVIAELRETIAYLRDRLTKAEAELDRIRDAARNRQRNKRSRHSTRHGHVTVTLPDEGDLIGGETPVSSSGSTDLPALEATIPGSTKTTRGSRGRSRDGHVTDTNPDWVSFRETYPKTDRTSWPKTHEYWAALSEMDQLAALNGCRILTAHPPEPQFLKGAQSWLYERRWETVADRPTNGNGYDPHAVAEGWLAKHRQGATDVIDVTPL